MLFIASGKIDLQVFRKDLSRQVLSLSEQVIVLFSVVFDKTASCMLS